MAAATAWVRSLSCKYSTAVADDAYSPPPPKKHPPTPQVKGAASVPPERERDRESRRSGSMSSERDRPATATARKTKKKKKEEEDATSKLARKEKPRQRLAALPARASSALLEMTELPEGHPSRRVVELIFASGWARADTPWPEAEVEALFRVHGTARALARFEAARAAARARGEAVADARCAADGNEVMRFQCRPAAEAGGGSEVICAAVATCHAAGAARAVRTFASSAAADAGSATEGRRGMLVCRVIAGRVRRADTERHAEDGGEYDSVEAGDGELVVLDRRAVLPCFLVVYRVIKPPPEELSPSCSTSRHSR
ncbi:hypothetical protein D1007_30003 [Hordeum vulgare]|nr:hypothetical protein D1007_30003 [Hordeum vulgare]